MIYDEIKKIATEKGLSIRAIEMKAGIGNGVIDDWNERSPSINNLQKVAEVLEVPVGDLLK